VGPALDRQSGDTKVGIMIAEIAMKSLANVTTPDVIDIYTRAKAVGGSSIYFEHLLVILFISFYLYGYHSIDIVSSSSPLCHLMKRSEHSSHFGAS